MSRTPEVEAAMAWATLPYNGDTIGEKAAELLRSLANRYIDPSADYTERQHDGALRTLAAEVERLEAELAPYRDTSKGIGGYIDATVTSELNAKQRAEAAEARVKELENRDVEKLAPWLTPAGVEKTKERLDDGTVGEVLFIASILRSMAEDTEVEANDLLADGSVYGAEDAQGRVDMYWHMYEAICEISESGRTKAEARVRELEAHYACKRHHGGEDPAHDMLRSCQICGLTVDISKGHCEPTIEFTMQGRTDKKAKKVAELQAHNAKLRAALEFLLIGYEGLGGDMENNAPRDAKAALADTKGTQ